MCAGLSATRSECVSPMVSVQKYSRHVVILRRYIWLPVIFVRNDRHELLALDLLRFLLEKDVCQDTRLVWNVFIPDDLCSRAAGVLFACSGLPFLVADALAVPCCPSAMWSPPLLDVAPRMRGVCVSPWIHQKLYKLQNLGFG